MEKVSKLRRLLKNFNLDGYIIPKNDEFFGEYLPNYKDRLQFISDFSGSYGFAIILKNKNFLFVDGRYTLQAKIQSGKRFKIFTLPKQFPFQVFKKKKDLKLALMLKFTLGIAFQQFSKNHYVN